MLDVLSGVKRTVILEVHLSFSLHLVTKNPFDRMWVNIPSRTPIYHSVHFTHLTNLPLGILYNAEARRCKLIRVQLELNSGKSSKHQYLNFYRMAEESMPHYILYLSIAMFQIDPNTFD